MDNHAFMGQAITRMVRDGVTVQFNKRCYNTKHCYPYFCEAPNPTLVINYFNNRDDERWFTIFVHEYCHYIQWKNEFDKWRHYNKYVVSFDSYLNGDTSRINKKTIRKIQELELDCETKTIIRFRRNKLDVDIDSYIIGANNYLLAHDFMAKYKVFEVPPVDKRMIELLPSYLMNMKEINNGVDGYEELFLEHASEFIK